MKITKKDIEEHKQFYEQSAISAMQGLQESGSAIFNIAEDLTPRIIAKLSFVIADCMLEEYIKKLNEDE